MEGDDSPAGARDTADCLAPGTVWADMTTLLRWNRPVVGIVRVEQQLGSWILAHDDRVRFCRYDRMANAIVNVSRQRVAAHIDFLLQIGRVAPRVPKVKDRRTGAERRNVRTSILRRLGKKARRTGRALEQSLRRVSKTVVAGIRVIFASPSALQSGDVYISVGSNWDDNDLARLYQRKQRDGFKVLVACYDMIPAKFPHLAIPNAEDQFIDYVANLARVADHVLCISKCSEKDLIETTKLLQCPTPETSVIRLGSDLAETAGGTADTSPSARPDGRNAVADASALPFVLFVSTIERRKNHETLYKAWVCLFEAGCAMPNLVFVGMRGWGVDDLLADLARDERVRGRIHVLHNVSDAELAMLYERCLYTVYPSLYEGWGLPVVESFSFGKFCLCSNAGSLPEAGGDLAEYLDPWNLNAWIERIRYFADHPKEIERRNQKVAQLFRPHSWHDTSQSIMMKAQELAWRNE